MYYDFEKRIWMLKEKAKKLVKKLPVLNSLYSRSDNLLSRTEELFHEQIQMQEEIENLKRQLAKMQNRMDYEIDALDQVILGRNRVSIPEGKIAVYTAIIDKYDVLWEPDYIDERCDYYCFTNNKEIVSDKWNIVFFDRNQYPELEECDSVKVARYIKTHPHVLLKNYKQTLWVDANLQIKKSIVNWIGLFLNDAAMLTFKHPLRDCIYEEGEACKEKKKDACDVIDRQLSIYRNNKYPEHNGLIMTNVLYRKNNKTITDFNEKWWMEIKNGSRRDQLSFNYVAWKTGILFDQCHLNPSQNYFFAYYAHEKR